jgi:hypothetical protein
MVKKGTRSSAEKGNRIVKYGKIRLHLLLGFCLNGLEGSKLLI